MVDQHPKRVTRPWALKALNYIIAFLVMCLVFGCTPEPIDKAEKSNDAVTVISKSDLTKFTSVYLIEVDGQRYVVVNGTDKLAIARHN